MPHVLIEVCLAVDPLLNMKLMQGLLRHGRAHPNWAFSFRSSASWQEYADSPPPGVSGLMHVRSQTPAPPARLRERLPYVALLGELGEVHPQITIDDGDVGRLGASHLIGLGLTNLAFCGTHRHWSQRRERGFVEEAQRRGMACNVFNAPFSNSGLHVDSTGDQPLMRWLAALEPPVGLLAAHDRIAAKVIDLCRLIDRRVPDDLAVLGVGNHELICEVSSVPISSIDTALDQVSERGAALLGRLIEGEPVDDLVRLRPGRVASRLSTDTLSYDDPQVVAMLRFIRHNATESILPQDVTDHAIGSRRTLERRFLAAVGRSIGEEIRLTRCRIAHEMLLGTNLPLIDIAVRCGYSDLAHFSRQFKQVYGAPPSIYRQTHGGRLRT